MALGRLHIATVSKIPIFAHASWLVALTLVTLSLHDEFSRFGQALAPVMALATALAFFATLLAHELGHAIVAIRRGTPVVSITLFIFGGVAQLAKDPARPKDELAIASAGPLVSVLIGVTSFAASRSGLLPVIVAEPLGWLGRVNLGLAVFNCLPGFPLDGGRVARALLWTRYGDRLRATQTASSIGRGIGYLLVGLGGLSALVNVVSGMWLAFVGWFLVQAATASYSDVALRTAVQGIPLLRVVSKSPPVVDTLTSVETYVAKVVTETGRRAHLVTYHGEPYGYVTLEDAARVPHQARAQTGIQWIAHDLDTLPSFPPVAPLEDALPHLAAAPFGVVRDGGTIIGFIERDAMLAFVEAQLAALAPPRTTKPLQQSA